MSNREIDYPVELRRWADETRFFPSGVFLTGCASHIDRLRSALKQIIDMNVQYARDRYGDENKAESMACVRVAREALAGVLHEQPKTPPHDFDKPCNDRCGCLHGTCRLW